MVTGLFANVKLPEGFGSGLDGRPLLTNALLVLCDDVLLFAQNQRQMVLLLDLFLTAVSQHRMCRLTQNILTPDFFGLVKSGRACFGDC